MVVICGGYDNNNNNNNTACKTARPLIKYNNPFLLKRKNIDGYGSEVNVELGLESTQPSTQPSSLRIIWD